MPKNNRNVNVRVITAEQPIAKAETTTQITVEDQFSAGEWISPLVEQSGLQVLVDDSDILPQCIRAYRQNIAGFGIGVRYKDDIEENAEAEDEFKRATAIVDCLTLEDDTKEIFEDVIEARETFGVAYVEVMRNLKGEVVQLEFVKETTSIRKTKPMDPYLNVTYYYKGIPMQRKKQFRKYRQDIGAKTVYYKEFGDTRTMDNRTGNYLDGSETLDLIYQSNEILEFSIGSRPYGTVRWIGQILGVDGSRKAENLNNNYFENGRHTPLAILINGGTLTDESFKKLQGYMNDIKGEHGQHGFIVLETEATDNRAGFEEANHPTIEMKDLASILQKDELFQGYVDSNRKKVQSAFQLPDLYVAYTTDFNRATAQTAMEVTEEQVFQPERTSLSWIINNKLLNEYRFKYVETYFLEPSITNPDDLFKIMSVARAAGGLSPNKAKEIMFKSLGETSDDFKDEWGEIPLEIQKVLSTQQKEPLVISTGNDHEEAADVPAAPDKADTKTPVDDTGELADKLEEQIDKAVKNHDDDIVVVMKEVKRLLIQMGGEENETA